MSKIFSKVLAICALVVTLPLLVIGTSLTAYYSINASIAVGIYTNAVSASSNAYAKVNAKSEDFEITKSHLTTATLKAESVGYDFVGWYEGTTESYAEALATVGGDTTQIEFVSQEDSVTLKMAEIENVLAVFDIKTYTVSYNYKRNPLDGSAIEDVPTNGKSVYNFGEALPTLTTTTDGWAFRGWNLLDGNGEVADATDYTVAEFAERDEYILWADWKEADKYTVTYAYGDLITGKVNEEETDTYEGREKTLKDPTQYATELDVALEDYERLAWVVEGDTTKTPVTTVSGETTVVLTKIENVYTVTITETNAEEMAYDPLNSITFTNSTLSNLAALYTAANWNTQYSFWKFDADSSIKFGGTAFGSAQALANAIYEANANGNATVEVTATVKKYFTALTVSDVTFRGTTDGTFYTQTVYVQVGSDTPELAESTVTMSVGDTTITIHDWIYRSNVQYFTKPGSDYIAAQVEAIGIDTQMRADNSMAYAGDATINDFIELLYVNGQITDADLAATLTIDDLHVNFVNA